MQMKCFACCLDPPFPSHARDDLNFALLRPLLIIHPCDEQAAIACSLLATVCTSTAWSLEDDTTETSSTLPLLVSDLTMLSSFLHPSYIYDPNQDHCNLLNINCSSHASPATKSSAQLPSMIPSLLNITTSEPPALLLRYPPQKSKNNSSISGKTIHCVRYGGGEEEGRRRGGAGAGAGAGAGGTGEEEGRRGGSKKKKKR